ncbi:hypothetical protein KHA80_13340 [Anaerobacillus sp. HL2]|nr:hypothetical protein KHA80_13340 [Anaerobacillus sp. HL2]
MISKIVFNFERRMKQVEDRYWKQFTAMETSMQQANSQAEQLYNMLWRSAKIDLMKIALIIWEVTNVYPKSLRINL